MIMPGAGIPVSSSRIYAWAQTAYELEHDPAKRSVLLTAYEKSAIAAAIQVGIPR